jgi:hypothetical protein
MITTSSCSYYSAALHKCLEKLEGSVIATAQELIITTLPLCARHANYAIEGDVNWTKPEVKTKLMLFDDGMDIKPDELGLMEPWYVVSVTFHGEDIVVGGIDHK